MYNARDSKEVLWLGYALDEKNPDGSEIKTGENLIQIVSNGQIWGYYDALEKKIIYDPKESKDHADWCESCEFIGSYCGQCGGGYWKWEHKAWQVSEKGWHPTRKDWKEELVDRACNGDQEAIVMLDQM